MGNPARHPIYPISWAYSIVNELTKAYPRATEIVYEYLGLNSTSHAKYLAFSDPMWPKIREMIHMADRRLQGCPYEDWSMLGKANFCEELVRIGGVRAAKRLDSLKKRPNLEEQGFRGDSKGENESPELDPLFISARVTRVTGRPNAWELN